MIFDWIKHGREILRKRELALGDKWDRRMAWTQEVNLIRYLAYHRDGVAKQEGIYAIWASVKGGTAEKLSYDPEALKLAFAKQWRKAKSLGPLSPLPKVRITDVEAEYVDRLSAPLPVKRYWLRLLAFIKTKRAMGERTTADKGIESFLMADAGIGGRPCDAFASVSRWSLRCGVPFAMSVSSGTARYPMPAWANRGSAALELDMEGVSAVDRLLNPKPYTCQRCGKRYAASNRKKTGLCGACYERKKREDARERNRAFRKKRDKI